MANGNGPHFWLTKEMPTRADLEREIESIKSQRLTGTLTVNFSQGTQMSGSWKTKLKTPSPYDSPELHLVQK